MARVAVVVPWRPDGGHRDAAWEWVQDRYEQHHPTWEVVTGGCVGGSWCKAAAVADALTRTDADTLLVADADVWCVGLQGAVDRLNDWPWCIPHHTVYRLTEGATAAVLNGGELTGPTTQHPYKGYAGGGMMILPRTLYDRVPLDPRFAGWGQEDSAWHFALCRIAGMGWRGRGDLFHLWHPPQERMSRQVGSEASAELLDRYRRAKTADEMAALLAEVTDGEDHPQPERDPRLPQVV